MAVKMRLMRMGKKRSANYRVVVIDGRSPRDGRFIEQIGRYDPQQDPSLIEIDNDKAVEWLRKGVQPTDPVRKLLEISGAMSMFKVASGKIHTVGVKTPVEAISVITPVAETIAEPAVVAPVDEIIAESAVVAPVDEIIAESAVVTPVDETVAESADTEEE